MVGRCFPLDCEADVFDLLGRVVITLGTKHVSIRAFKIWVSARSAFTCSKPRESFRWAELVTEKTMTDHATFANSAEIGEMQSAYSQVMQKME
jgi:hypothetical protein